MLRIGEVVEELRLWVFEKSKVPFEVKILGIATCIQTSSVRRTARILSGFIRSLKPLFGTGYGSLKRDCLLYREEEKILDGVRQNSC